jgi:hypothetical protein
LLSPLRYTQLHPRTHCQASTGCARQSPPVRPGTLSVPRAPAAAATPHRSRFIVQDVSIATSSISSRRSHLLLQLQVVAHQLIRPAWRAIPFPGSARCLKIPNGVSAWLVEAPHRRCTQHHTGTVSASSIPVGNAIDVWRMCLRVTFSPQK